MSRKFIASVLAASLAITSISAAPARADGDDLMKFLAGATALVIIGKALDSDRKRTREVSRHDRDRWHDHGRYGRDAPPHVYFDRRHDPRATRDAKRRYRKNVLPAQCRNTFWTPEGRQKYMDNRCLKRNYSFAHELPKKCKIMFYDHNQKKRGYSIKCLKDRGYRLEHS